MTTLLETFATARKVSTPLVAIDTPDPAATVEAIVDLAKPASEPYPVVGWDIVRGLWAANPAAESALATVCDSDPESYTNPTMALTACMGLPMRSIVLLLNAHRYLENDGYLQAIWLLRDLFKADGRCLVLLGAGFQLPPELAQDVLLLTEPLPGEEEIAGIARQVFQDGQCPEPDEPTVQRIVDTTTGMVAFAVEQALAMSLNRSTGEVDWVGLTHRKRTTINQQRGLSVWEGGDTFADVAGYPVVKEFGGLVIRGKSSPRVILWLDELEKAIGTGLDTSGVSQALLGYLLTWMQDSGAIGMILVGPPGSGKSALAKAIGGEAQRPTIKFDLTGMKSSLVGESEGYLRSALKVVDAVSQGRCLVVATCNNIAGLPPELRRRFSLGIYMVDLPDGEERAAIWQVWLGKYFPECYIERLTESAQVQDEGWTGAEIQRCVDLAWRLDCPLAKAAKYVVPVSVASKDAIDKLRTEAHGRYLSASHEGYYQRPVEKKSQAKHLMEAEN